MKIEHIAMYVNDLKGALKFFSKYFSAKSGAEYYNENTGFRSYFLSFENGSRLEIMTKPDINDTDKKLLHSGYAHIAFSVGSTEKVDELTEKLSTSGYSVVSGPRTTGDGYYESCVLGFEDNLIEITV